MDEWIDDETKPRQMRETETKRDPSGMYRESNEHRVSSQDPARKTRAGTSKAEIIDVRNKASGSVSRVEGKGERWMREEIVSKKRRKS